MARCEITCYLAPMYEGGRPTVSGPTRTMSYCSTHHFTMDHHPTTSDSLCPLGRIEQAVEDGIAKIKAAAGGKID